MELDEHTINTLRGILDNNEDHKIRTIAGLLNENNKEAKEDEMNPVDHLSYHLAGGSKDDCPCQESGGELKQAFLSGFQNAVHGHLKQSTDSADRFDYPDRDTEKKGQFSIGDIIGTDGSTGGEMGMEDLPFDLDEAFGDLFKTSGEKYDSCVEQLKSDGKSEDEAHAICQDSVKKNAGLERVLGGRMNRPIKEGGWWGDTTDWLQSLAGWTDEGGTVDDAAQMKDEDVAAFEDMMEDAGAK